MSSDLPLSPEDVAEIVAILEGSAYEKLEIKTSRFTLRVAREGGGWTQDWSWDAPAVAAVPAEAPAEQPARLAMDRGVVLLFKATDFDTGAGIEGVSFWYEPEDRPGSHFGVQPSPSFITNPKTNEKGELRIIAQPGMRKYGVGFNPLPAGYQANVPTDSSPGRELTLTAGEERVVEFLLRKSARP